MRLQAWPRLGALGDTQVDYVRPNKLMDPKMRRQEKPKPKKRVAPVEDVDDDAGMTKQLVKTKMISQCKMRMVKTMPLRSSLHLRRRKGEQDWH